MQNVLVIYIRSIKDILSLSAQEQSPHEQRTIEFYENISVSRIDINNDCSKLFSILNSSGRYAKVDRAALGHIKYIGQSLFDKLFTLKVKELIHSTQCQDFILKVDGSLVQVPWELLHDGSNFLCQRFNIGRMVSTRQKIGSLTIRKSQKPLKMLILADPKGDLDASYEEGIVLRRKFEDFKEDVEIDIKTTSIKTDFIKRSLREYDIIHYAGHAKYDLENPFLCGWEMVNGLLSTADIIHMRGGAPLPLLIFSNACRSGQTEPWHLNSDSEKGIYGLANAFLLSGVQHYIGTFWDIPDSVSLCFAVTFYQKLLNGMSIGKSLRDARGYLLKTHGKDNTTWMAYMLYGDPTFSYFGKDTLKEAIPGTKQADSQEKERIRIEPMSPSKRTTGFRSHTMSMNEIESFSAKRFFPWLTHHFKVLLSLLFLIIILIGITRIRRISIPGSNIPLSQNDPFSDKEKNERIRDLIKDLGNKIKEKKKDEISGTEDSWTSRPISMAVFGYISKGNVGLRNDIELQQLNELIARHIDAAIKFKSSIPLVDRRHLEEVLLEHQLTLSDFAHDQQSLVEFGKIFGARIFLFSELLPQPFNHKYEIDINIVDTETTKKIPFMHPLEKERDYKSLAREIADMAINKIGLLYSMKELKGRITSVVETNQVKLNVGSLVGLRSGHIMDVYGERDRNEPLVIGKIEVIEIDEYTAMAKVLEKMRPFVKGDRVFYSFRGDDIVKNP